MAQKQALDKMCPAASNAALGTKVDDTITLIREMHDDHATQKTVTDELVATLNELITQLNVDMVVYSEDAGNGCGLAVDANAEDVETVNDIVFRKGGLLYRYAADAAIDISAECVGAGDTVTQAKSGAMWLFVNTASSPDGETDKAAQDYASAIEALAQYSIAGNTLPPGTDDVCFGIIQVTEGDSGAFTWGTGSITDETETYYSLEGLPGIETVVTSFALDEDATTFTYGAVKIRLGTGTRVAATGKANVTITGTNVAATKTGAWLFYVLADDTEIAVQLGAAYADFATAQAAVGDHTPNPLLPLVGVIYVQNASGANFVPGTTKFDATGITATFTKVGTGANWLEVGRAALGQPNQVLQNASAGTLTASKPDALTS